MVKPRVGVLASLVLLQLSLSSQIAQDPFPDSLNYRVLEKRGIACCLQEVAGYKQKKFEVTRKFEVAETEIHEPLFSDYLKIQFQDTVLFNGATFNAEVGFYGAKFDGNLYFKDTKFMAYANFAGGQFNSATNIRRCVFEDTADFRWTKFALPVVQGDYDQTVIRFIGDTFNDVVLFNELKCWGTLSFESVPSKSLYSVFKGNVYFSAASFYSDLRLAGTNFEKNLIFRGALFNGFVFTNDMGLPDTLDFSQVQRVEKRIDFTQGKLQPGKRFCYINLTGSDVSKVRLNYDIFRLTFDLDASDGDKCSVYEGLLSNFEQDGFAQSYKILDIEYYKYKYERDEKWFINWLQKWWWNYGYNKEKIFPNSLILLVCFFLSNLLISLIKGPEFLMRDVYYVERLWEMVERIKEKTPGRLEYVRGYLPYLFIYTVMIFFVLNLNIKYLKYSSKIGLAWVMFTFIVGLACAAYIVNFVLDK